MQTTISKSQFKPQVLEYLREVEKEKKSLVITHAGRPVAKVIPYTGDITGKMKLQNSIVAYKQPYEPVALTDWEAVP